MAKQLSNMWLYQMSEAEWPEAQYRAEVWEGGLIYWSTRKVQGQGRPVPGDRMICWYATTGAAQPGVVGWGVILGHFEDREEIIWRPTFPSDGLKMRPLYDDQLIQTIDSIRGKFKQATMWPMSVTDSGSLADRIRGWFQPEM